MLQKKAKRGDVLAKKFSDLRSNATINTITINFTKQESSPVIWIGVIISPKSQSSGKLPQMSDSRIQESYSICLRDLILRRRGCQTSREGAQTYDYRPQRSCGQGYVFTRVCDSVNRGGLQRTPPWDQADTPPGPGTPPPAGRAPPRPGTPPPWEGEPPWDQAHPSWQGEPPLGPGTPPPSRENPPGTRHTPTPPRTKHTPLGPGTPPRKKTAAYGQ